MEIGETSAGNRNVFRKIKIFEDDDQEDRLSNLPDPLLVHILSFLPIEDAVKTMMLRRFGQLWTSLPNLEFDGRTYVEFKDLDYQNWLSLKHGHCHIDECHYRWLWFFNFVTNVISLHDCPYIFKFSLKFGSYLYFSPNEVSPNRPKRPLQAIAADDVRSWINFAIHKKVRVLDLGILAHDSSNTRFDFDLPDTVSTCESLFELNLVNVGLTEQLEVQMRRLKTLSLTSIVLTDKVLDRILAGCPLMETLSIIKCRNVHKLNCTSTNLKHLYLVFGPCPLGVVEICGPHLSSIHIEWTGLDGHIVLKNIPSLVEAFLDISLGGNCRLEPYTKIAGLLEKIHHANTFTITNWCILVLSLWELTPSAVSCSSSPRKLMTVKTQFTKWHLPGILSLIKSSPNLETLVIHIETETSVAHTTQRGFLRIGIRAPRQENFWNSKRWLESFDFNEKNYWQSQPPFNCLVNHLKTLKISGCLSNPRVLLLIRFLLSQSRVLENMVVYTGKSMHHPQHFNLQEFYQKVLSFPKVSNHVQIIML